MAVEQYLIITYNIKYLIHCHRWSPWFLQLVRARERCRSSLPHFSTECR